MATINWIGNAHATKQIDTITVADTWTAADTVTLTMNGKDIIITIGDGTTTAQVAESIRDAWNASSRIDGTGSNTNTSNAGGQEFGEFSEATAVIYPTATSVVRIIGNVAGRPFTLSVAQTVAVDGTATEATAQAATGPWHWNNGDNWSAGAVPANDDVCVFRDNDVPVKYGLPNGSLEVTIEQWQSYTGQIGLPPINRDNASKPYFEYRQRYVRLDDAGTGTNIAHRFGIGHTGTGSSLINLKHSTLKCSPIVFNTGSAQQQLSQYALNICCTANTSTLDIINGSVDYSSQDGSTSAFVTVSQVAGDSRSVSGTVAAAAITIGGGTALVGGTAAISAITLRGGTLRLESQSGTITTLNANGGTVLCINIGTITALLVNAGSTFDARNAVAGFILTQGDVYPGGRFLDPYRKMNSASSVVQLHFDTNDIQFGATVGNPIVIAT